MVTKPTDQTAAMAQLEMITDRQRAVLDLVVQHWTSKEIARELGISPNTVDQRINAVRTKLGARDRAETARLYAELNGISGISGPAQAFDSMKPVVQRLVRPAGFEPTAPRLGIWCSILLSYGRTRPPYGAALPLAISSPDRAEPPGTAAA